MGAGVQHGADGAVGPPVDDHRLAAHPDGEIVAGRGNLALMREIDPVALENRLDLGGEDLGVRIDGPVHPEDALAGAVVHERCKGGHRIASPLRMTLYTAKRQPRGREAHGAPA